MRSPFSFDGELRRPANVATIKILGILSWAVCVLPSVAMFIFEETPGLSGLDGISAAALGVMSPLFLAVGFAFTAAQIALARWLFRKRLVRSRVSFALLSLAIVGVAALPLYWDDWRLLGAVELAAVPAALLLAPGANGFPSISFQSGSVVFGLVFLGAIVVTARMTPVPQPASAKTVSAIEAPLSTPADRTDLWRY
jgi:hypothetical protein